MTIAPVAEAAKYCLRGMGRKKWLAHERSWDLMVRYCVTPPVTPVWERTRESECEIGVRIGTMTESRPRLCIACGRVHITSEDCGRESTGSHFRSSVPRKHDGYSLQRAENMGCFSESDNWE